mgnify:CR=1 FL=1
MKYDKVAIGTCVAIGMLNILYSGFNSAQTPTVNALTLIVGLTMMFGGFWITTKLCDK